MDQVEAFHMGQEGDYLTVLVEDCLMGHKGAYPMGQVEVCRMGQVEVCRMDLAEVYRRTIVTGVLGLHA